MAEKQKRSGPAVIIYDGQCPVCQKTVAWIRENMLKDSFEMVPCQSEEARKRFPFVEQAICMQAMQLVLPEGKVLGGEKALPEIVKRLKRFTAAALSISPAPEPSPIHLPLVCGQQIPHRRVLFPDKER
jgi:predicted DCC family thiol-disulfide oxidoreductase YuxK